MYGKTISYILLFILLIGSGASLNGAGEGADVLAAPTESVSAPVPARVRVDVINLEAESLNIENEGVVEIKEQSYDISNHLDNIRNAPPDVISIDVNVRCNLEISLLKSLTRSGEKWSAIILDIQDEFYKILHDCLKRSARRDRLVHGSLFSDLGFMLDPRVGNYINWLSTDPTLLNRAEFKKKSINYDLLYFLFLEPNLAADPTLDNLRYFLKEYFRNTTDARLASSSLPPIEKKWLLENMTQPHQIPLQIRFDCNTSSEQRRILRLNGFVMAPKFPQGY